MDQKNNADRILECLYCEYFEYCFTNISDPQDNVDGSCKTREILSIKGGYHDKSRTS